MAKPQIIFYILPNTDQNIQYHTICQLIANLYHKRISTYINCSDQMQSHLLDEQLWTYDNTSFIPHNLITSYNLDKIANINSIINIGTDSQNNNNYNLPALNTLINLSATIPNNHSIFKNIIEFVPHDDKQRDNIRKHYLFYKKHLYLINTQKLSFQEQQ